MKNKAASRASLRMLVFGAAVLGGVFLLCVALIMGWILQSPIGKDRAEITVTMPRTGGLFEGSAATYRGVRVGEVTNIDLSGEGIDVTVLLNAGVEIPKASRAKVRSLSPVGEQYVDFRPEASGAPYLADGDRLSATAQDLPVSIAKMVTGLQGAMRQVDPDKVRTVLREVNTAFEGSDEDLSQLLENTEVLLDTVDTTFPSFERVLRNGKTSLEIFADNRQLLIDWAASAATVGTWFLNWNPTLRATLSDVPKNLTSVLTLLDGVDRRLPGMLSEVEDLTRFLAVRGPHLEAMLETIPYGIGRFATVMYDGYFHVTANLNGQETCDYGADHTDPMSGRDSRKSPDLDGQCGGSAPWRGANHAPEPLPE